MLKEIKSTIITAIFVGTLATNVVVGNCNIDRSKFWDQHAPPSIEMQINQIPIDIMSNFSNTQLDHVWINGKMVWSVTHV